MKIMWLLVNNPLTFGPARRRRGAAAMDPKALPSAGVRLLLGEQGVIDMVGNSDAAGLGERFGILLAQERAPDADGRSAAERSLALDAGEHLAEHGMEELRLEIDR